MSSTRGKLGGWLLAPSVRRLRDEIDPETPGGAYMLGLRQLGVVAHGRFTRRGFARAIEVAARFVCRFNRKRQLKCGSRQMLCQHIRIVWIDHCLFGSLFEEVFRVPQQVLVDRIITGQQHSEALCMPPPAAPWISMLSAVTFCLA